jgi:hypothetical protein
MFCMLYASYLVQASRQLKNRLYQSFRLANMQLQLQVRSARPCCVLCSLLPGPGKAQWPMRSAGGPELGFPCVEAARCPSKLF